MIGIWHYLVVAVIMFCIGIYGLLKRQNLIMLFFASEILLNSANVALVAIGHYYNDYFGQIAALFIIAIAASEVAVGLGLLILWYKKTGSIELSSLKSLKG